MKLDSPDWKTAWFENHISDRFFQEMAKLDKGSAKTLETTAQWMNQMMVETGILAQSMSIMEVENIPPNQVRVASDKALRLAALAVHLMTALDAAHREGNHQGSVAFQSARHPLNATDKGSGKASGTTSAQSPGQEGPEDKSKAADKPFATHPLGGIPTLASQMFNGKEKPEEDAPRLPPEDPMDAYPQRGLDQDEEVPLISPFLDMGQAAVTGDASPMRSTIASLHHQGLSRAEIGVITGQPRHIVEAVIDNEKKAAREKAATQAEAEARDAGVG